MRDAQPVDRPLNLTAQDFFSYGSWILTAALIVFTIVLWRRDKTPYYLLIVLAAMVAAFGEPLYDEMMMLYFYTVNGGESAIHTHFTAFDVPQPIWTHSGYAILYGFPAVYVARKIHLGTLTKTNLYVVAVLSLAESGVFEIIGTSSGAYTYWGPHVFRIVEYPLAIGMLEMAQVVVFAVAAAELRKRVTEPWQLAAIFLVFPCTFALANYGGGMAMIVGLHAENTNEVIRYTTTLISMGCAILLVRLAASFLPATIDAPAPAAPQPDPSAPQRERAVVVAD